MVCFQFFRGEGNVNRFSFMWNNVLEVYKNKK